MRVDSGVVGYNAGYRWRYLVGWLLNGSSQVWQIRSRLAPVT
jgi:hypothetical protein